MSKPATLNGRSATPDFEAATAIILTGTDPATSKGGIGTAVSGYRYALMQCGLFGELIPTYKDGSTTGKWLPWLQAFPALRRSIRALRRQGKGVVVYGQAGPRLSLLREFLALAWARAHGARTMMQLHAPHMDRYMNKPWVRVLLRIAFLPVDQVTVLSPWWQRRLAEGGFPETVVVPNPLSAELEAIPPRTLATAGTGADVAAVGGPVIVLAMARLTRGKGIDTAVRALAHLPDRFELEIAGDGPQMQDLQDLARQLGVDHRTRFLGWISGAEKDRRLSRADIFCAPSRADAFSMSMIEAMCHGLPIVTVRSRAIGDLVRDGQTGYVVDIGDAEAVARAVSALEEPAVRAKMGQMAARWALDELGGEVVGRRIERAAAAILAGAGS